MALRMFDIQDDFCNVIDHFNLVTSTTVYTLHVRLIRWPTTVTSKPNAHSKLQIAHIKFKSFTANSNRSQQIQIAHSELQITHNKLQIAHSKFKSPTANSNRSQQIKVAQQQIQIAHIKLQINLHQFVSN